MTTYRIQRCTVADIEAHPELHAQYAAESAIPDLGTPVAQFDTYRMMEAGGILHLIGAFDGDELVGFVSLIVSVIPHFGVKVGTTESYFVASHARKGGTGAALREAAEALANELGAVGMFISAPAGGRLDKVLPVSGYRLTNQVYFKGLQ